MTNIGIIGAGVAGLQLGLYLRQQGIETTLYAEKTPVEILGSRVPALVARTNLTHDRERALGVNHWDGAYGNYTGMNVYIGGEQPMSFSATLEQPFIAVDMRIYTSRLLEDFAARGGHVVVGAFGAADVERLSEAHDLLVIATGRSGITELFERVPEHSPFTKPQRVITTGIFRGITQTTPLASSVAFVPGIGEIFEFPIYSFEAHATGLGVEAVPGSPFEALAHMRYEDDPQAFNQAFIDMLREHAPSIYARLDEKKFGLVRPLDLLQGGVTPAVRRGYAKLSNGRYVLAIGDTHVSNDPILGQGANTASYAAFLIGEAIAQTTTYDEAFLQDVEARVWDYAAPIVAWSTAMLGAPEPHMIELMVAATQIQSVADEFCSFFANTREAWRIMSSKENAQEFLARHGWQGMPAPVEAEPALA
jgi:2-polyprenyl-6-methoxyphenol hydroxylase-like FAD-dependent oxidoreductase